jgi:hypothetical protein
VILTAVAAGLGFVAGFIGALSSHKPPNPDDYPSLAEHVPLPHHVPSQPKGAAFRFAMVHDVLHERFPKHGHAYYQERNRQTRANLAKLAPNDPAGFPLTDDLATGLARLGQPEEAIALMRAKLARQQAMKFTGVDLYTTSANLGTLLVYTHFLKASAGDAEAVKQFREGVGLIRKSVELNPGAHFGREQWQAAFAEFLLAAMEKPDVLKTFDFLGNRLDLTVREILDREMNWTATGYGRATDRVFNGNGRDRAPAFFSSDVQLDQPSLWPELQPIRVYITKVGAETGWEQVAVPSHRTRVAFDEPMLGIVDMWRQGGGANPHLALALGETMLRVGQRYIAWTAYERAAKMADRFWPDRALQQFLREHCILRQDEIETNFRRHSPPSEKETGDSLRSRFNEELAYGEAYQREYQRYEAEKIAAGAKITDEHFFDAFHVNREPIASPVGAEEWYVHVPPHKMHDAAIRRALAWGLFAAGWLAMMAALALRLGAHLLAVAGNE